MNLYCPTCGKYHEQNTAGSCPISTTRFYPNEYYKNLPVNLIESKLDEIIRLLKLIIGEE